MKGEHFAALCNASDGRECCGGVTGILVDQRRDKNRTRAPHEKRVTIWLCRCDRFRADIPPAPPVRFSTITGCPRAAAILSEMSRAIWSGGPPAGDGTTSLMGRSGYACALCNTSACATTATKTVSILFMVPPDLRMMGGIAELASSPD